MKTLDSFDLQNIKDAIICDLPELEIASISLIDGGWDNVVAEVNKDLIFRFPRTYDTKFDLEIKILECLQNKISTQIPRIHFIGKSYRFMAYKKIQGSSLNETDFGLLTTTQRENFISEIANFLMEMHQSISVEQAKIIGVEVEDLASYSDFIREQLSKMTVEASFLDFIQRTITEYEQMIPDMVQQVCLYNDLHMNNIAFDMTSRKLHGVFDFGDVMIGDVNMDFYPLYQFNPNFMKAVAEKYQEIADRKLNLRKIVVYGRISKLTDFCQFIDQPQSAVYKNSLIRINQWIEGLNEFK